MAAQQPTWGFHRKIQDTQTSDISAQRRPFGLTGWLNPSWVKAPLAAMVQVGALSGDGSNVHLQRGAPGQEYNGLAGSKKARLYDGQKNDGGSNTFPFTERGSREGMNKNASGTREDVRMLCKAGRLNDVLHMLKQVDIQVDYYTYICLLRACINMKDLAKGKQVHTHIVESGFKPNIVLLNTLVNMYTKCGSMVDARLVFDKMPERDMFTWTIMMAGYANHGHAKEAFQIYERMQGEGVTPDRVTFICVLNACANLGSVEKGKEVHADIIKAGIASYINLETALVGMYAKCGSIKDARQVFDNMARQDVVSWSAMIAGYAQQRCSKEALDIYKQMQQEGVTPDRVTFISVLNACANLGALEKGKEVHADIIKAGIASYVNLQNSLLDMYCKCGSIMGAREVFNKMAKRDVISWSAMITGCAQQGHGREALELFENMQQEGLKPNSITFLSVLSACSHVGLVDEGCKYFDSMSRDHGLTPTVQHFGCMIDLLGRAGRLDEAEDVIMKMPMKPDASVWGALLGACRIHGYVRLAERAAKGILECDS